MIGLEIEHDWRDETIKNMQERIDELEQHDQARNIIVTGIKHDSVTNTVKKLNRKLSIKLKDEEIHYIAKLKSK